MHTYKCSYDDISWTSHIVDFDIDSDHFIQCTFKARGSRLVAYIGCCDTCHWIVFPEIDRGCSLAPMNDPFWNFEKLLSILGNEIDATTVASGLNFLYSLLF